MTMRPLLTNARGGVGVFVACAMPLLIGFAAFAIDLGTAQLDARRLQGIADSAALAAASTPGSADAAARSLVAASWGEATVVRATPGRYRADASLPIEQRFTPAIGGDAVQVQLSTRSPTFFARIFGYTSLPITRRATAQRRAVTSFSIGSRLAALDGGIVNALLSALTGRTVSLTLLDHRALAESSIDVFQVLDRLKVRAGLSVNSYGDLLAADARVADLFGALSDTLRASGQATAADAVARVAAALGGQTVRLGALIDAGPLAMRAIGSSGTARVPVLPFMTMLLETGGAQRLALDLGASVPGLASTKLSVAIGERARSSPWLAITDAGDTVVRTAQARIYARVRVAPTLLPGLSGLASIDLPLFVEAAGAEARLKSIECDARPRAVVLEGRVNPAQAAIGAVDETKLTDFSHAITPGSARIVDTLLVDVTGSSRVSLGAAEPWQARRFTQEMIDEGATETIRASAPLQGIATSLIAQASLKVTLIGLPLPVDPLLRAVGSVLSGVAAPLDTLLMAVTGTLGVGIAEGDMQVNSLRCGNAVLVG